MWVSIRRKMEEHRMKLGFIGCGNMAGAMIGGILKAGLLKKEDIIASALHEESRNLELR